jgi:cutinase
MQFSRISSPMIGFRYLSPIFAAVLAASGVGAAAGQASAAPRCSAVDVVVARGTDEPGTLGSVVGDPVYAALRRTLDMTTTAYRVNYPAKLSVASVDRGSVDLVAHVEHAAKACPDQRFILVGYSQGAYVVDSSLRTGWPTGALLPPALSPRIAAVLLFGNPLHPFDDLNNPYADRTADFCAPGDPICEAGRDFAVHMSYGADAAAAAAFAAQQLRAVVRW